MEPSSAVIVGDGPTGLSAALLLAKNGFDVTVVGANRSPVHRALLRNYLGDDGVPGPDFLAKAREHAERYGARLRVATVERIEAPRPFRVHSDAGVFEADYLVIATGYEQGPAQELDLARNVDGTILIDRDGKTSIDGVYAGGAVVRGSASHVATSVGDGAAIATHILSLATGRPAHDYDVLPAKRGEAVRR